MAVGVTHHEIMALFKTLPKTEFAFYYPHVSRKMSSGRLIVAVDDIKQFHKENLKMNKGHYTYAARLFKEKLLGYFAKYGAKIHFNTYKLENNKSLTYGVVSKQNLVQDLNLWETL